jgi:hypothetical protein
MRSNNRPHTFPEKILSPYIHDKKYYRITLPYKGKHKHFKVHRLVAQAFLPNPENKTQVNHKDLNKLNNHLDNLEWVTGEENIEHYMKSEKYSIISEKQKLQFSKNLLHSEQL